MKIRICKQSQTKVKKKNLNRILRIFTTNYPTNSISDKGKKLTKI